MKMPHICVKNTIIMFYGSVYVTKHKMKITQSHTTIAKVTHLLLWSLFPLVCPGP